MSCWSRKRPQKMLGAMEGGARETCARWVLVCADGGTALNHCTQKKKTDSRSRACRYQAAPVQRHLSPEHKSIYPFKWNWHVYCLCFSTLPLCLSHLCWWGFGEYLGATEIIATSSPGPTCALEEEALVAPPLSQSGTQLCASHSAQHYLVTAAASLGLSETKSSQSQLSLLLNSFLFSVMHLLQLFHEEKNR